jgi:putative FmdB family regulatory protein
MPLYEYRCTDCGQDFEKVVRFSEADLKPACPFCASTNTMKRISAVSVIGAGSSRSAGASSGSCSSSTGFS